MPGHGPGPLIRSSEPPVPPHRAGARTIKHVPLQVCVRYEGTPAKLRCLLAFSLWRREGALLVCVSFTQAQLGTRFI